jgi:hypothetical protein
MFLGSSAGMVVCLAVITGATARYQHDNSDKAASSAMIAFIFIFGMVFAVGFTAMQPVYSPEILSSKPPQDNWDTFVQDVGLTMVKMICVPTAS